MKKRSRATVYQTKSSTPAPQRVRAYYSIVPSLCVPQKEDFLCVNIL
nr:MAG TPA: hypothetical protein [Caudoviricetes sp.]